MGKLQWPDLWKHLMNKATHFPSRDTLRHVEQGGPRSEHQPGAIR